MTWALARYAADLGRMAFRRPDTAPHGRLGPAMSTAPKSKPDGSNGVPPTGIDLRARAERLCNRSPRLVARYLETQAVLMTGRGG